MYDAFGHPSCPYCGCRLHRDRFGRLSVVCDDHRDLLELEPLDDRYTIREDGRS
jgi:hypothetical protein